LFFGCFWAVWRQKTMTAAGAGPWSRLTAIAFVGLVLLRVQFAAISLVLLSIVAAVEYLARSRSDARNRVLPAVAVALTAAALLASNYSVTGLLEVTPFRTFWRFADQERF